MLLVATVAFGVCLVTSGAHRLWRASVFMPVFFVNLLLMQARARTCVVLAALGAWDLGCGVQRVPDRNLEKRLRHRAYVLLSATLLATVVITLLFVIL